MVAFIPRLLILIPLILAVGCFGTKNPRKLEFAGGDPGYKQELFAAESMGRTIEREDDEPEELPSYFPSDPDSHRHDGLVLQSIPTTGTFKAGERISLTVNLRNTATVARFISYSTTQRFDLFAFKEADTNLTQPIFRWSDGQVFAQLFQEIRLLPNEMITRTIEVETTASTLAAEMVSDDMLLLPPGRYFFVVINDSNPPLYTAPMAFEVRAP